uniref:Tyrosine-protein kinase ephrin type A/B receptor-like domain-containing protein n=1 Tax=Biomphalaria glabrata TaxID=6526 RepID=A0A2C9LNQ5_BIOGL
MGKIGWLAPVGLVLVAMWFSVDAFRYSYYISITVKKSEVSEATLGAVGGVIADWIPLSYTNANCDQTYRLISTKSLTQQLIGTLELSCTNDNWYDYFEAIQASVYDNLVSQQYHVTVNDLDIEVLKLNVFNSSSDALQNINALELSMCFRDFSMCQPEEFCYDTTFKPVCLASCDYGQYLDNGQCVSCPSGQTTLMLSAWSIDRCVGMYASLYLRMKQITIDKLDEGLHWVKTYCIAIRVVSCSLIYKASLRVRRLVRNAAFPVAAQSQLWPTYFAR